VLTQIPARVLAWKDGHVSIGSGGACAERHRPGRQFSPDFQGRCVWDSGDRTGTRACGEALALFKGRFRASTKIFGGGPNHGDRAAAARRNL